MEMVVVVVVCAVCVRSMVRCEAVSFVFRLVLMQWLMEWMDLYTAVNKIQFRI